MMFQALQNCPDLRPVDKEAMPKMAAKAFKKIVESKHLAKVLHFKHKLNREKSLMPKPTKNPRINITVEEDTAAIISKLAKNERKSVSSIAKELILEALERREDMVLSSIAEVRDVKRAKKIKHEDAWK